MSVVTLFTRTAPTLGGYEFDAVLEDTFESSVEFTQYPIESGASVTDHGIILPKRWSLIGAVSNNPLRTSFTDFSGIISNFIDDSTLTQLAGLSSGLLSGSDGTRATSALTFLIDLQNSRVPFEVDCGDITLSNMVIVNIRRTKTPGNEEALIFEAELQELPTLDAVTGGTEPAQSQLRDDSTEKSSIAAAVSKGRKTLSDAADSVIEAVEEALTI